MKYLALLFLIPQICFAVQITATLGGGNNGGSGGGGNALSGTAASISAGLNGSNRANIDNIHNRAEQYHASIRSQSVQYQESILAVQKKASQIDAEAIEDKSIEAYLPQEKKEIDSRVDLSSIPDPVDLPEFKSQGPQRQKIERLYKDLSKIEPKYGKLQKAKELGLSSVMEADEAYSIGNNEDGHFYQELAEGFLDLAVGLDPITGMARSAWELCYGRNFITGAQLSTLERGVAFLGVVTAGSSKSITQATRALTKVYHAIPALLKERAAIQAAIREGEVLGTKAGNVIRGWKKNHRITHVETAEAANLRFGKLDTPPYQAGSHVVHFETVGESKFVRVHEAGNANRAWMVRRGEIRGLTPEQIRDKLNLPSTPTHVSEVVVPAKTGMSRGMTNANRWEHGGELIEGQVQYKVESTRVSPDWIKDTKPIGVRYE